MTAPPLVFGMSVAPSSDRASAQLPLGSERGDDLYALWKRVFDRSHAVQRSEPPTRAAMAPERYAVQPAAATLAVMPGAVVSSSAAANPSPHAQPCGLDSADAGTSFPALLAKATSGHRDAAEATVAMPAVAASVSRDTTPESLLERGQPTAMQFAAVRAQDSTADSVSVHVQGAAVSIVVRDASLSEQEALRLGFETARRLTGQRASLAQLTLNGQVAYQQPNVSDKIGLALVFTC